MNEELKLTILKELKQSKVYTISMKTCSGKTRLATDILTSKCCALLWDDKTSSFAQNINYENCGGLLVQDDETSESLLDKLLHSICSENEKVFHAIKILKGSNIWTCDFEEDLEWMIDKYNLKYIVVDAPILNSIDMYEYERSLKVIAKEYNIAILLIKQAKMS